MSDEETKDDRITFRVTESERALLDAIAVADGEVVSEIVRKSVRRYLVARLLPPRGKQ